jgi:uncharacterized repeat protein (TIGR03803 family)
MNRSLLTTSVLAVSLIALASADRALAQSYTFKTLASFNGANGSGPVAALTIDSAGNLYGTTSQGGTGGSQPGTYGTVFKLDASHDYALSTIVNFNFTNGSDPAAGLIVDAAGNLYGTTQFGGAGYGTVFNLNASKNYALSTLATFNSANGSSPEGGLTMDASGNLYGTTYYGGTYGGTFGSGTVFRLNVSNNYAISTLASFNQTIGCEPRGEVIMDASGNLYGTTALSGACCGMVFKLVASNGYAPKTLVSFNYQNGAEPCAGLIMDAKGNLYGTTNGAGSGGTVFELNASRNYALSTLASFSGTNGTGPVAGLIMDAAGNLYGTTALGGTNGDGTVFKLDASNNYALMTLYSFAGADGADPEAELTFDATGDLFGTTTGGGVANDGTVFELTPAPEPATLSLLTLGGLAMFRRRKSDLESPRS